MSDFRGRMRLVKSFKRISNCDFDTMIRPTYSGGISLNAKSMFMPSFARLLFEIR